MERVLWFIRIRWIAIGVAAAATWAAYFQNRQFPVLALSLIVLSVLLYNTFFHVAWRRLESLNSHDVRSFTLFAHVQISLDLLALYLMTYFTGGIYSPLIMFAIFHIILAGLLLSPLNCFVYCVFVLLRAAGLGLATVFSGPAGGVYGAWRLARELGEKNILTLDMGGTSTDVALLPGESPFTGEYQLQGYPLGLPVMDIHTVGAGGGSIAYRDRGGALRVGPQSAGADPGPVCYGRGDDLTVTDAQLCGRLLPQCFLGGRLPLSLEAAHRALERLAGAFGVPPLELALGIIRVANSHMAKAMTQVSLPP